MLAIEELPSIGVTRALMRNQLRAQRWVRRSDRVVSTTTGELTRGQLMWLGVLHAGNDALVGGLTAASVHGLRNWERDDVTILVPDAWSFDPVPGLSFFRTRRPLGILRATHSPHGALPVCRLEPAILLFGGYDRSPRTAQGVVAACVQQRLTSPDLLRDWVVRLRPLRRSRLFQRALLDIEGGAQSLSEIDVRRMCRQAGLPLPARQRPRRDRDGRLRFTDAEWRLNDGRVVVLEVDGGFHADVEHYEDDMKRQRRLTTRDRVIVRCGAFELRHDPESVAADLRALGVGRLSA
ncbi:MAG: hypothetical protein QOH37_2545 [Nocardioidaceae bacterium]|jgi:hypothetical protein|nr:hypothetical protein [Nocardioidaceae bacterium]